MTSTQPIAVSVYGFREGDSYGFTAAMAAYGEGENSNDVILRYNPNGSRDASFGNQGMVLIDHAVAFGSSFPSFDKAKRAIVDGGGILVGGMSINATSEQSFFASYRLEVPPGPVVAVDLEFFMSASCDPSGHGEAELPLGRVTVSLAHATENFDLVLPGAAPVVGAVLTATAADPPAIPASSPPASR